MLGALALRRRFVNFSRHLLDRSSSVGHTLIDRVARHLLDPSSSVGHILIDRVSRHLLDSLSILPWLRGERLLDVGTGAGLPGIPLAIVEPGRRWALLDSNGKKTRFLRHVVRTLGLGNVSVVEGRAEAHRPGQAPDCITARALATLPDLVALVAHLCPPGGRILAMKGRLNEAELAAVPEPFQLLGRQRLTVPGLASERNLIVIEHK